jgi:predicted enzyme related to lactoylglutathione lyase
MKFYRDVLELEYGGKTDIPNDYGYEFKIADNIGLWVGKHSEVKGYSKEPVRRMTEFYVDDLEKWYEKIKAADVKIIAEPFSSPMSEELGREIKVLTFHDPEGNCLQLAQGYPGDTH